jgi:hypothetical protein
VKLERPIAGDFFRQFEDRHGALDRAHLRGRVVRRDLFVFFDVGAEREGEFAFARQRVVDVAVGVGDRQSLGQADRPVRVVLNLEEDAEVVRVFFQRRLADEVGGVLVVVFVQVAGEDHGVLQPADLDDFTLFHVARIARPAGGDSDREKAQDEGGEQRHGDTSIREGHERRGVY